MIELYHAFAPILPIFILLMMIIVIVFLFLNRSAGKDARNFKRRMTLIIYIGFTVTIVGMILVTLMPTDYPNQMIQLVPFSSITETLEYATPRAIVNSLLMNIILFIPFGLFLYILTRKPFLTTVLACLMSISIEVLQYVLPIGRISNIDDVILNTLGGIIGMLCGVLVLKLQIVYNILTTGKGNTNK
ncbi:VanZ family protein [Lacicoccus qingdaonensis]|uniref:Glycopeptide antibiotics resistance protein n=1 Tax=Lacicoccus qingdaonensis TaxID=576118 RepID=A0A1G9B829_9BACL|nr:VanZ family protein [Salinicoccus qingdaonensis]SDK35628.1 Glycopeptide antibiotics resistance protein [Salinicoccus qingdaonensis]